MKSMPHTEIHYYLDGDGPWKSKVLTLKKSNLWVRWAERFENLWKEVAIADNGRSQSMDGPGAEGARYKKNGELRQPRTQEEKVITSLNREFLKF